MARTAQALPDLKNEHRAVGQRRPSSRLVKESDRGLLGLRSEWSFFAPDLHGPSVWDEMLPDFRHPSKA
jgi:hypothetical protein